MKIKKLPSFCIISLGLCAQGDLAIEDEAAFIQDEGIGVLGREVPDFGIGVVLVPDQGPSAALVEIEDLGMAMPHLIALARPNRRRAPIGRMRPSPSAIFCRELKKRFSRRA